MTIRSAAPLIAVRNVPSSVAFYGKFGPRSGGGVVDLRQAL